MKIHLIILITILISTCFAVNQNENKEYTSVYYIDGIIINYYYPDTLNQSMNSDSLLYNLSYLPRLQINKYFTFLTNNNYGNCREYIDGLLEESDDKGFLYLLEFRMYIHAFDFCCGNDRKKITESEKMVFELASNRLKLAKNKGIEAELISELQKAIAPFLPEQEFPRLGKDKINKCYSWFKN